MFSVVESFKTGKLELAAVPAPASRPGFLLVANRASLVSAGTERAAIELAQKSLAGKALARPDLVRQVISKVKRDGLAATIAAVRARLDTPLALFLGHTVIATPLVIVMVRAALQTTNPAMEFAARSLGAGFWRALWYVTLPSVRAAIGSAAAFAFLISFDDVVIAIFVAGPNSTTLPKRMWETIRFEIDPTLTAIASLLTVVAVVVLVTGELLRRSDPAERAE